MNIETLRQLAVRRPLLRLVPSRRLPDEDERDHAKVALERAFVALRPETPGTEEKIDAFARLMREKVTQGPIPFRRAYLRSDIDQVEVDRIRIHGRRDVLERLVMSRAAAAGVPSFCIENGAPDEMKLKTPTSLFFR
ncbi:hypothetical protein HFO49_09350 [Rhizobium leguminosarum]|uniref:hypothetical protein n=1 Tax=Rhizobium leguminosarum TaxID=384 RepID=UPI001C97BC78|nr:hypothetical protein [Rhizobium leguminosarum]MBY5587689.1 hypothetical protein [Rhizobium leguminosarum]MBY5599897.1 hypothetical protein [Rhizobium leguminosarum]